MVSGIQNVTEAVTLPKPQKKEIRVLTTEEVKRLLRAVRGDRFETLYVLAVTTGMRQEELLGLKWEDVNLEEGVLRITRTVWARQRLQSLPRVIVQFA